jgi:hypothetical protein
MEAFTQLLTGLVDHPVHCMLAVALVVIAYLYKAREGDRKNADARATAEKKASDDRADAKAAAHLATVEKVIPVAEKLADGVTTLERLMMMTKEG